MDFLETGDVETWLLAQLKPGGALDATLKTLGVTGVYGYRRPQNKPGPHVVFSLVVSQDENAGNGTRGATKLTYLVKAVAEGEDSAPADAIMRRVDILLQQKTGSVPGLLIKGCVRELVIKYPEVYEGKVHWHVGGQYYLWGNGGLVRRREST